MTDYIFAEEIPAQFNVEFDMGIFHHPHHITLQAPEGWCSFFMIGKYSNAVIAVIYFHLESGVAKSPYRSPYGSIVFSDSVTKEMLTDFVTYFDLQLKEKGVKKIVIKNQPQAYDLKKNELLKSVLNQSGYIVMSEETSAMISVNEHPFESIIHPSEKKRLRKCNDAGLVFEWRSIENLKVIYEFLSKCREEKAYSLSMTLDELNQTVKVFPDRFLLSVVKHKGKIIAANISIRVNNQVLYNFYHDHTKAYDNLSPVVFLNKGVYEYCQQDNIKEYDLGTSQTEGGLNESLLKFKLRLGARAVPKFTFAKNLG